MRSACTALALLASLAAALAARLHGSPAEPAAVPVPAGLVRGSPAPRALSRAGSLAGEVEAGACPRPIAYAAIPPHFVSVEPAFVAGRADGGRAVVFYDGLEMPQAFAAEAVIALYLATRLAQALGLREASFGSEFVVRFAVPAACAGLPAAALGRTLSPGPAEPP